MEEADGAFHLDAEVFAERVGPDVAARRAAARLSQEECLVGPQGVGPFENDHVLLAVVIKVNRQRPPHHRVRLLIKKDRPLRIDRNVRPLPKRHRRPTHEFLALPI